MQGDIGVSDALVGLRISWQICTHEMAFLFHPVAIGVF